LKIPFEKWDLESGSNAKVVKSENGFVILAFKAGEKAVIKNSVR
jgi:hypothetical protein